MCCCFCCCQTRFSLVIYMLIITSLAFIFGIVVVSTFGSNTDIYNYLMKVHELDQAEKGQISANPKDLEKELEKLRTESVKEIFSSNTAKLGICTEENYEKIKSLKGIELGLGSVLFSFSGIFLGVEILFMIFICGVKEFQVLSSTMYNIFNIIRIVCIILSIAFIALCSLYSSLLAVVLVNYLVCNFVDECFAGILIGIIYGGYGFWFYIMLSCAFCTERQKFALVGSEEKPGPDAKYDVNGNPIGQPVPVTSMQQPRLPQNNQIQLNPSNAHPLDVQYYPQQQNNTNANPQYGDVQDSTYRNLNNKGPNQNQNVQIRQNQNNMNNNNQNYQNYQNPQARQNQNYNNNRNQTPLNAQMRPNQNNMNNSQNPQMRQNQNNMNNRGPNPQQMRQNQNNMNNMNNRGPNPQQMRQNQNNMNNMNNRGPNPQQMRQNQNYMNNRFTPK